MPELVRWLLAALTCYRLAQFMAIDDGPCDVFLRLRDWAGASTYGQDGRPATSLGRLVSCPYCIGVWAAVLCAAAALWPTMVGDLFLAALGLAGAQAALQGARHGN